MSLINGPPITSIPRPCASEGRPAVRSFFCTCLPWLPMKNIRIPARGT